MFKKRKWIIISILAAVVVVALGVIGGAAYAQSGATNTAAATAPVDPQKVLADKVAVILGIDAAKVEAAFAQAQKEMQSERQAAMLKAAEARIDQMVTDGKISAEEAAKYKTWLESKPDVQLPVPGMQGGFGPGNCGPRGGFGGGFGRGMMPRFGNGFPAPAPSATDSSGTN
jgi:hypothetical protein